MIIDLTVSEKDQWGNRLDKWSAFFDKIRRLRPGKTVSQIIKGEQARFIIDGLDNGEPILSRRVEELRKRYNK